MTLGSTQPLTEMSTRNISCVVNLEALTPRNPQGLSRPVQGLLYLYSWFWSAISSSAHTTNPQIRKMAVTGNCTVNMQYKLLHLLPECGTSKAIRSHFATNTVFQNVFNYNHSVVTSVCRVHLAVQVIHIPLPV